MEETYKSYVFFNSSILIGLVFTWWAVKKKRRPMICGWLVIIAVAGNCIFATASMNDSVQVMINSASEKYNGTVNEGRDISKKLQKKARDFVSGTRIPQVPVEIETHKRVTIKLVEIIGKKSDKSVPGVRVVLSLRGKCKVPWDSTRITDSVGSVTVWVSIADSLGYLRCKVDDERFFDEGKSISVFQSVLSVPRPWEIPIKRRETYAEVLWDIKPPQGEKQFNVRFVLFISLLPIACASIGSLIWKRRG